MCGVGLQLPIYVIKSRGHPAFLKVVIVFFKFHGITFGICYLSLSSWVQYFRLAQFSRVLYAIGSKLFWCNFEPLAIDFKLWTIFTGSLVQICYSSAVPALVNAHKQDLVAKNQFLRLSRSAVVASLLASKLPLRALVW